MQFEFKGWWYLEFDVRGKVVREGHIVDHMGEGVYLCNIHTQPRQHSIPVWVEQMRLFAFFPDEQELRLFVAGLNAGTVQPPEPPKEPSTEEKLEALRKRAVSLQHDKDTGHWNPSPGDEEVEAILETFQKDTELEPTPDFSQGPGKPQAPNPESAPNESVERSLGDADTVVRDYECGACDNANTYAHVHNISDPYQPMPCDECGALNPPLE